MKTIIYYNNNKTPEERSIKRKPRLKLPNYLIRRKILIIREKIMARKYGIIYLKKVYGKYYPSECKRYYEKKLLKKYFEKVRLHWFEEKEVHRLFHEANIFYNQKLISKTFNGWMICTRKSRIIKQRARIVKFKYDQLILQNILQNWKAIYDRRKIYKLIKSNAIELFHIVYTLLALLKSAEYLNQQIEQDLLEIKSILCWRFFSLRKYYRIWKIYILEKKRIEILRSKAENYYRTKIRLNYFLHWQKYVCYKITKHEIVQICTSLYQYGLLKMFLKLWKSKTTSRTIEKKNMLMASKFYNDLCKRKLLKTWRRYIKHKLQGKKLKHKTSFFYTMRLKQKVLDALSKNVTRCKNSNLAIQKLKLFYKRLLTMNVWNKWIELIDEKNDFEMREKILQAILFHKENLTRKYLKLWIRFRTIQQKQTSLRLQAVNLCKEFYCEKYLHTWKIAYREKQRVTMLNEKARKFLKDSLIRNAILQWIGSYNCRISMKMKYEKSVLHHERKITSKCFISWINFCNGRITASNLLIEAREYYLEIIQRKVFQHLSMNVVRMKIKRGKVRVAENSHQSNIVMKAFANWREYCVRSKKLKKEVEKFDEKMRNKLKRKMILQWKLYVHHKKCSKRKSSMSVTHRRKKECSKIFKRLKNYVDYKKRKNIRLSYLNHGIEGVHRNLGKTYLQYWRVARLNILKEKCRIFHAAEFHASQLKRRYFLSWRTFLINHKIKREHQSKLSNMVNRLILKNYLQVWYTSYKALLKTHFNEIWVGKIYDMKIRHKYFVAWKYFAEISIREKREINKAKELHKKLVIKEGLQYLVKIFLRKSELRYETQLRNVKRNTSHEFDLLKKYFIKWHQTVSYETMNKLKEIKDTDLENVIPTNLANINDKKYVSDLIPRFVIPEFMKKEVELRFGIGRRSNRITTGNNEQKRMQTSQISRARFPLSDQKNILNTQTDYKNGENMQLESKYRSKNDKKFTNTDIIRSRSLNLGMKMTSPNQTLCSLSPDSLISDSDSAKTYIV